jgi:hypothetical protein
VQNTELMAKHENFQLKRHMASEYAENSREEGQ